MNQLPIIIVGGGLSGSLLAILLAKRGFDVHVYERRPDMRVENIGGGRSINLALSARGIHALKQVGLDQAVLAGAVAMKGRMTHDPAGNTNFQPYGKNEYEYINSISRSGLNIILMNEAEKYPNVRFHFSQRCTGMDWQTGEVTFHDEKTQHTYTVTGATVFGTDGSASAIRQSLRSITDFQYEYAPLGHGYKELTIFPDENNGFRMDGQSLHIWPRKSFMLIALPNLDRTFTCTLFYPESGAESFEQLTTPDAVNAFFQTYFPDIIPLIPDLTDQFLSNPLGHLGTVKCFPWTYGGKALLVGDAAHAVVPFYGQGMNCSFEDCIAVDQCIERFGTNWEKVFSEYQNLRKANTDAIADMALENFIEMRDHTANPTFIRKRHLELRLETMFPDRFISKYGMVTFRHDIPYALAKNKGNLQDEFLMNICSEENQVENLSLDQLMAELEAYVTAQL
jgi:kynurenine 3-monooxygenase